MEDERKPNQEIEPDKEWYTKNDVWKHKLLGPHSNRIESFARRTYCKGSFPLLELDREGNISKSSLLKLKERLRGEVILAGLRRELGLGEKDPLWNNYGAILHKYIENVFPMPRKGYTPLYVLKEGTKLEDLKRELQDATQKSKPIVPQKSLAKPVTDNSNFLVRLVLELAKDLSFELASGIESRIAGETKYTGQKIITEDLYNRDQLLVDSPERLPDTPIAPDEYAKNNGIPEAVLPSNGKDPDDLELNLVLGTGKKVSYLLGKAVITRYCRNEGLDQAQFMDELGALKNSLAAALGSRDLKPEMKIRTKLYGFTIRDGKITSII